MSLVRTMTSKKNLCLESISESKELHKLNECLLQYKRSLCEKSPTARLWLQYMEYVGTLKLFIRAERTGNWNLHLVAVERMLNLFAATGHVHYAKSARLYLQMNILGCITASLNKVFMLFAGATDSGQDYGLT